ncbi:MAG TPA: efflux RND transporter periplasmic adaptor subunit [Rhizomicrobium sp.]|nr:efflux RND transporter periplasmic adaptor subunit [Rhizomicrobium sp.]
MTLNTATVARTRPVLYEGDKRKIRFPGAETLRGWREKAVAVLRRHPRLYAILALILLATVGYAIYGAATHSGPQYVTATVTRGDIEDTVTALGNLQPKNYVDVGAQATGQLKNLYVDIGDAVKQGQLLAVIDPQVASAKVAQDQGNLANLKAQLADKNALAALAKANLSRQTRLMAANATSKADYDSAVQAAKSAVADAAAIRGQIAAADSELNGDQVTLGYTKIYAPMSGTVVSEAIKQGQTINSVQQAPTLLRIADLSTMEVWTQVSEADVPKLKLGMTAYFTTLGQPDKRWYGKLVQIQPTPTVTNNVVLYTAIFDVANPDNQLMTQMTAQVFFVVNSAHNVVTVPVSALHQGHGRTGGRSGSRTPNRDHASVAQPNSGHRFSLTPEQRTEMRAAMHQPGAKRAFVQVVQADGSIMPRMIVTGVSNRVSAEVLYGLKEGEKIVVGTKQADAGDRAGARTGAGGRPRVGGFP